jgi:hypothetical protein
MSGGSPCAADGAVYVIGTATGPQSLSLAVGSARGRALAELAKLQFGTPEADGYVTLRAVEFPTVTKTGDSLRVLARMPLASSSKPALPTCDAGLVQARGTPAAGCPDWTARNLWRDGDRLVAVASVEHIKNPDFAKTTAVNRARSLFAAYDAGTRVKATETGSSSSVSTFSMNEGSSAAISVEFAECGDALWAKVAREGQAQLGTLPESQMPLGTASPPGTPDLPGSLAAGNPAFDQQLAPMRDATTSLPPPSGIPPKLDAGGGDPNRPSQSKVFMTSKNAADPPDLGHRQDHEPSGVGISPGFAVGKPVPEGFPVILAGGSNVKVGTRRKQAGGSVKYHLETDLAFVLESSGKAAGPNLVEYYKSALEALKLAVTERKGPKGRGRILSGKGKQGVCTIVVGDEQDTKFDCLWQP